MEEYWNSSLVVIELSTNSKSQETQQSNILRSSQGIDLTVPIVRVCALELPAVRFDLLLSPTTR